MDILLLLATLNRQRSTVLELNGIRIVQEVQTLSERTLPDFFKSLHLLGRKWERNIFRKGICVMNYGL